MPSRVNDRFQITIPKGVREALEIERGGMIEFGLDASGHVIIRTPKREFPIDPLEGLIGCAKSGMTTDEIMAITRGED